MLSRNFLESPIEHSAQVGTLDEVLSRALMAAGFLRLKIVEPYLRMTLSLTIVIVTSIRGNSIKPRGKSLSITQVPQPAMGRYECLLAEILRLIAVSHIPQREVEHSGLPPTYKTVEGRRISV